MKTSNAGPRTRQVVAAVIGNALEWYDFIVFGFMTGIISSVFFPSHNAFASLLLTAATFGVGFVMRPFGGVFVGIYADRRGRKAALQLVIALMTVATALIAFAPSYATIGAASSLLIVIARMLQGLAAGGEFASSTAFLIEMAPESRRGLYGSWQMVGQGLALLTGALSATIVIRFTTHAQLLAWGWRIPFVLGLLIAPVGYWIRNHLQEPEAKPDELDRNIRNLSMAAALQQHGRGLVASIFLTASATIAFYILVIYMPTYANRFLNTPLEDAFAIQCVAIVLMTVITPLSGALSDRIGRRALMQWSLVLYLVILIPLFSWFLATGTTLRLATMQIALCVTLGVFLGPFAASVAEIFPTRIRSTGMAISYNISVMLFGGFAPMIVTWLLGVTGSRLTPAYYLMFGAALGIAGCVLLKRRGHSAMSEAALSSVDR